MNRGRLAVVAVAGAVLAGCAAHHPGATAPVASPTSGPVVSGSAAASFYGHDPATLVDQVPGCEGLRDVTGSAISSISPDLAGDARASAAVASASTCPLKGHPVLVLTFADSTHQGVTEAAVRTWDAFYASGPGWLAVAQESQPSPAQESTVQSVAAALAGRLERGATG